MIIDYLTTFTPIFSSCCSYLGRTGFYLALLTLVSVLLCLTQIAFQVFLAIAGNEIIPKCEFLEILLRHIGLVRLDNLNAVSITVWLAPEIISFIGSIIIFIVLKKGSKINVEAALNGNANGEEASYNNHQPQLQQQLPDTEINIEKWRILVRTGKVLSLLALCATGALQPSALSVIYYLIFLGSATWWGMNKQLERYAHEQLRFITYIDLIFLIKLINVDFFSVLHTNTEGLELFYELLLCL